MEEKAKKRTWVKDVAIVFLAVMLVLTFFSNTILNRSLPEAATVMIEPGSIDSKVRISGTVTAKENYDVILEQSRKVASVAVKTGQEVSAGDVLFTLEPGDSDELESAKDVLHSLELQYQKQAVSADNNDYAREKRNIELAKADVERAQTRYDRYALTAEELTSLEASIEAAESDVKALQKQVEAAQTGVCNSSDGSGWSGGGATAAQTARLASAKSDLEAANLKYKVPYERLTEEAKRQILQDKGKTETEWSNQYQELLPFYQQLLAESYKGSTDADALAQYVAYTAISAAQQELNDAQAAVDAANESDNYDGGTSYQGKSHSYWVKQYNALKSDLDDAQEILDGYKAKKTNYEESYAALDSAEDSLRNLQDALEDAQRSDRLEAIDLQELQRQISDKKAEIEKLSGGDSTTEIKAKVSGTVQSLAVSAGHTANAGDILATIEVPDLGYSMAVTVTNEQARLLHVGDTAQVSNFYWGAATQAEITAIRPDPKNPQSGKLLMLDITGDVAAGSTLNFSIGEKNANYDYVLPNSAVRSDTNGSFILIITAKNSPLGNRYYATRVAVEVLASDDLNSAVNGALEGYETVITTTSNNAPLKNGDQVRLSDVNG